jgi:hypothetical protein
MIPRAVLVLALAGAVAGRAIAPPARVTALVGGTLIDGHGGPPLRNSVGTVSEGKYADIIAVRGDVLRYIDLLQRVDVVVNRGRRYK